jgi:hypothetical protein
VALPVEENSVAIAMFRMVIAQASSLIRQRDEIEQPLTPCSAITAIISSCA